MALSVQTNHPIRVLLGVSSRRPIAANDVGDTESEAIQVGLPEDSSLFYRSSRLERPSLSGLHPV